MGATLLVEMRDETKPTGGLEPMDEARDADGTLRGSYRELFAALSPRDFEAEQERVTAELADAGVVFGGDRPFDVDPIPRIIEAGEWEGLERGLVQRTEALNAFLADVYGERRIVEAGVLPEELIETADWFEPAMAEPGMPAVRAHVAGPDLVRGADGELRVLEDNLRAPSGFAYALAARAAMEPIAAASGLKPRSLAPGLEALGTMQRNAAPASAEDACVVLLNDGPEASTLYEHSVLARRLGLVMAAPEGLRREGDAVVLGDRRVDVIYRRVDDERLTGPDGEPTALGELLTEPLRAGTVACVNSPGSGIADDKAVHTYVERMVGFYLDEPVLLRSVPGTYLGDPAELEPALARIGELVIKPRSEFGGKGVVIGPLATGAELDAAADAVRRDPGRFVAQETVALSLHPTVVGESLQGRHVDLRPYVISDGDIVTVVPGGLSRFAREAGVMVVNSGQGGGAKDTWVLSAT